MNFPDAGLHPSSFILVFQQGQQLGAGARGRVRDGVWRCGADAIPAFQHPGHAQVAGGHVFGISQRDGRVALMRDPAVRQHNHLVGPLQRQFRVVCGQDDGGAAGRPYSRAGSG